MRDERTERLAELRALIGTIENPAEPRAIPLGAADIDGRLGGGLAPDALHEIVAERPADGAAASGFALGLAARCAVARQGAIVWIIEDFGRCEAGEAYGPGLLAHGIDPGRVLLIHAPDGARALWAMEEALKSRVPAVVVADLWGVARHYGLAPSRRLVLAARASGTPGLLLQAGAAGREGGLSSAAQTRFAVAARASPAEPSAGRRIPLPGPTAWSVRLVKARAAGVHDPQTAHGVVWHPQERRFCNDEGSLHRPAASADRPAAARRHRAG